MSFKTSASSTSFTNEGWSEILDRNAATTAAVGVTAMTAGVGGVILFSAFPAQMLTASAVAGSCAYVGHRQYNNLPLNPFEKEDEATDKPAADEAAAA